MIPPKNWQDHHEPFMDSGTKQQVQSLKDGEGELERKIAVLEAALKTERDECRNLLMDAGSDTAAVLNKLLDVRDGLAVATKALEECREQARVYIGPVVFVTIRQLCDEALSAPAILAERKRRKMLKAVVEAARKMGDADINSRSTLENFHALGEALAALDGASA